MVFSNLSRRSAPAAQLVLAFHLVQLPLPSGGLTLDRAARSGALPTVDNLSRTRVLPEGYHTPEDINARLSELALGGCAMPLAVEWAMDTKRSDKGLFVARLGNASSEKRVLVVANEHAREAITAEVALHFVERVCVGDAGSMLALPSNVGVTLVPVANPSGRQLFDTGINRCQRNTADEGEGEIDLNRNGEVDWKVGSTHGDQPFSAYQARIIRDLAAAERPVAFVDLHSGAEALMVSWGDRDGVTPDFPEQHGLLQQVAALTCPDCPMGSNRVVIEYENPGELIDYMYARAGVKHSTLWEVFGGAGDCASQFNPPADELHAIKSRWAEGLHRFVELISTEVQADDHTKVISDEELAAHVSHPGGPQFHAIQLPKRRLRNAPLLTT